MDSNNKDVTMPKSSQSPDVGPVGEDDRICPNAPLGRGQPGSPEDQTCTDELTNEIELLTQEKDQWKSKAEDYWDRYLRARSEMENFRKRTQRDIHNRVNRGKHDLILPLLDVLDNFDRCLEAGEKGLEDNEDSQFAAFVKGVSLIQRQILGLLAKEGVEPIDDPVGKSLDPHFHEAVSAQDGGGEHGTIVEEIQKGYTYQGQLLRPSRVKVIR